MFMFGVLICVGAVEPYVCVWGIIQGHGQHNVITYKLFYWFCTTAFVSDMCLRFVRARKKSTREGVVLVTRRAEILKLYIRTPTFYIDLISAVPLSGIAVLCGDDPQSSLGGRILAVFRMVRLVKFLNLRGTFFRIHDVTGWSFASINIFQFAMMSVMVLHWIACLWASLVTNSDNCWMAQARQHYQFLSFDESHNMYLMSLYWSVSVLSSVGFGDIVPQARGEFFWAIICMGIGGTVWAYVVGSVCGISASLDKQHDEFKNLLGDVNNFCIERGLPRKLAERVEDFYQHAKDFMRMRGYHHTIRDLSPALKGEVVSWMYGKCFQRVWYFDIVDERCARLLTEGMVPKMYAPDEEVEASLTGVRCLVFLRSGLCVRKNNLLAPGACWGLDVILGSEEHHDIEELLDTAAARSINYCFVLKLPKNCIDHTAKLVPTFAKRLRKAHVRMLFWRGVIAAARAQSRLDKPETKISHTNTPFWDRAGKMMGQVVHKDCLLIHDYEATSKKECAKLHHQLTANQEDHPSVSSYQIGRHHGGVVSGSAMPAAAYRRKSIAGRRNSFGEAVLTDQRRLTIAALPSEALSTEVNRSCYNTDSPRHLHSGSGTSDQKSTPEVSPPLQAGTSAFSATMGNSGDDIGSDGGANCPLLSRRSDVELQPKSAYSASTGEESEEKHQDKYVVEEEVAPVLGCMPPGFTMAEVRATATTETAGTNAATNGVVVCPARLATLDGMKVSELKWLLRSLGANDDDLDKADDSLNVKGALIELMLKLDKETQVEHIAKLNMMKVSELKRLARSLGARNVDLDALDDFQDVKKALIDYILQLRSGSAVTLDAQISLVDMSWKVSIEEKLDDVREELAVINEGIVDDVESLRADLGALKRLMHQLLGRFDAEEKY
jgi:hypothetical protein